MDSSFTQAVDVTIDNPDGQSSTFVSEYTYTETEAVPTIESLSPSEGPIAGDTSVTITGTNFTGAIAVTFGGVDATSFSVTDAEHIIAVTPSTSSAEAVDVVVTTPNGTGTGTGLYTYTLPPVIFVTNSVYNGNLGGFSGANAKCNSDTNKPEGYTDFKALLDGNNATTDGVSYYRTDGTTLIATATGGNLVENLSLINAITDSLSGGAWTGAVVTCSNWSSNFLTNNGTSGATLSATSTYWLNTNVTCNALRRLYCVSQ